MSHTPGPWINDRSHPEWERNVVWSGDMVVARVVDDQHANADANARLIAAAPELLRELKFAVSVLQDNHIARGVAAALAAIRLAEGRE
jgi:hypothetical protein